MRQSLRPILSTHGLQSFWEWAEGDKIECFKLKERSLTLEEAKADSAVDFEAAMLQFEEEMAATAAEAEVAQR